MYDDGTDDGGGGTGGNCSDAAVLDGFLKIAYKTKAPTTPIPSIFAPDISECFFVAIESLTSLEHDPVS